MTSSTQPKLFVTEIATSQGMMELFPAVWISAEELVSEDIKTRNSALDQLISAQAIRLSPLVVYLVATRISEADLSLRTRILETLAAVMRPDENGHSAPDEVRQNLVSYFSQLSREQVLAILQVGDSQPELNSQIIRLINLCSRAGVHLADILADKSRDIGIRLKAAYLIGQVGFAEALPALKRVYSRIDARQNGQRAMPFAPKMGVDESKLLPVIRKSIDLLDSS